MTAPHGTRSRYVQNRCRCVPCTEANRSWSAEYRTLLRRHVPSKFVPSGPVIEHVARLRASGVGVRRICTMSGASVSTVNRLVGYRCGTVPARVLRTTAEAIFAVGVEDSRWADGTGSARRLRALIAIGHSRVQLAARTGIHVSVINAWVRGERRVTRESAATVADVYDALWLVWPTGAGAKQARREAGRKGWASPLAWEGIDIDDPSAVPDFGEAQLVSQLDRRAHCTRLLTDGATVSAAAREAGVSERTAERVKARLASETTEEAA